VTLRLALVGGFDGPASFQALAATLPPEWVVRTDLDPATLLDEVGLHGLDAVVVALDADSTDITLALLRQVQRANPETLRVLALPPGVDAGLAERCAVADGVQQVLGAPFDAGDVRRVMRRVLTVRSLLRDPQLRAALGQVDGLPGTPTTYLSLRMAMADDGADLSEAVDALRRDAALSARVLRMANSALYARGRGIHDVGEAVHRLGLDTIGQLVLSSEAFGRMPPSARAGEVEREGLLASLLASRIAVNRRDRGLASSAALLAGIGALLPGSLLNAPAHPSELWQTAPREALLGAALLAVWGLPMEIVEAVAFRHRPSLLRGRGLDVVGAVHAACALAAGAAVDGEWIAASGLEDRLAAWNSLAATYAAAQAG